MAAATLLLAGASQAGAAGIPPTATFDAGATGWTSASSCSLLCTTTPRHDGATNAIAADFATLLGVSGLTTGIATWSSDPFTYSGLAPVSAQASMRVRGTLNAQVDGAVELRLVDQTAGTTTTVAAVADVDTSANFATVTAAVDPGLFIAGHAYRIDARLVFTTPVAVLATSTIRVDDVALTTVDPTAPILGGTVSRSGAAKGSLVVETSVDPGGLATTWLVEWGTTSARGEQVAGGTIPASSASTPVSVTFTGLTAGTTIHWRFVATNAAGRTDGAAGSGGAPDPLPAGTGGGAGADTGSGAGAGGAGGASGTGASGGGTAGGGATGSGATGGVGASTTTGSSRVDGSGGGIASIQRTSSGVRCTIVGTPKADRIVGTSKRDVICGGGGNDIIDARGGNDIVEGGSGNDQLFGLGGNDVLVGGAGNDLVAGGRGNDVLSGGGGNDKLYGEAGRDRLRGGFGRDWFIGGTGVDVFVDRARGERFSA